MALQRNTKTFVLCGYLVISLLAVASCLSSVFGDFVFDDTEAVVNNRDVLPTTPLREIFQNDFWGTKLTLNFSHKSYRPLTVLSFRLNYVLAGGLHSPNFHLVNIILHVLVSCITWSVFLKILGEERSLTAMMASVIFAIHPIHTEAVCGIVGRADILSALFFFLSFLSFTRSNVSSNYGCFWLFISILFAAVSMFCKENGITVIGVCSVYNLLVVHKVDLEDLVRSGFKVLDRRKGRQRGLKAMSQLIAVQSTLALSGALLVAIRYFLMNFQSPVFQPPDNPASYADHWLTRTLTYNYIFSLNIWLMLCPVWLCFDWSMGCVPLLDVFSGWEPRILAVVCFWMALAFVLWRGLSCKDSQKQRTILLSLTLMVVPFLPASNLLVSVGFVIAERVLYTPSAGLCVLIASGAELLVTRYPVKRSDVTFGFSLLLMVFLVRSHERSLEWRTEESLFTSGLDVCPLNAKVHYNVGKCASTAGQIDKAVSEYREAIRLFPDYDQALNNLANILKFRGELTEAEALLRRAVKMRNDFPAAWMNLGIVLATKKEYSEAEKCYFNALRHRRNYPDCYYNLGNLYLDQKQHKQAEAAWRTALNLKPTMTTAWNNLIILQDNLHKYKAAVEIGEEAMSFIHNESSIFFNTANAWGKLNEFERAEKLFVAAIKISPRNALYFLNLGVLYHRWSKLGKAEMWYKKALEVDPNFKSAANNYKLLQETMRIKAFNSV